MRLHRLTLRDVKAVHQRTVELPDTGIVVLEGPNEVGKSTMLEAFDALLTFKATSKAAAVRSLQPVDRDVPPFVEAEFTVGGTRVRYAKQWLRQPSTTLHLLGARPEHLTGDAAQARMDGLLGEHLDPCLYDALRLTQASDGTVAPLASSTVLTAALDAAAGGRLHAEGADVLLDRVEEEYRRYFTATGRPTGDYRLAMARHTQAQQDVADAHLRVEEGRQLLERQEAARSRSAQAEAALVDAAARLSRAEQVAEAAESVAGAHAAAGERLAQAVELQRGAARARDDRERLVARVDALTAELEGARKEQSEDVTRSAGLREALLAAEAAVAERAEAVDHASDEVDAARDDADHLAHERELATREALLGRAEELVAHLCRTREALPRRQVSRDAARAVRALQDRLDTAMLRHEMLSPRLEVDALGADVGVVSADGARVRVAPEDTFAVSLAEEVTVEVADQVRVRVLLQQDARGRAAEIHRLRDELRAALDGLGAADVDEAEALADRTEAARSAVREAVRDVDALLRPLGAALAAEAAGGVVPVELTARVQQARARVRDHAPRPGRAVPADEVTAHATIERASATLRSARAEQRRAAELLAAHRTEIVALTARLERAEGRIAAGDAQRDDLVAELDAARVQAPDDQLLARLEARSASVAEATRALEAAAAAVADADLAGARAALARTQEQHRQATRERDHALAEQHAVGGQLEMASGEGRQELYDLAVAELDDAERDLQAVDRRARAARHLRSTLTEHRDAAHRTYVLPYTRALEDLGRRVFGEGFAVTVGEDLSLTARTLDGVTVPYADLSGGAKEQLGILARLAVARLVDPVHGVPVVIDDALGYSDPDRLRQMGEVLGSTAGTGGEMQVILLTCTPERYAAVPHASTVRLSA